MNGDVVDSNSAHVSRQLLREGFPVTRHNALPDDFNLLAEAIREISSRADLCICTGGLGPTEDDLTADVVARVLGSTVDFSEEALERMKRRFEKLGYRFTENNRRSTRYPRGAEVFQNEVGTAPAFAARIGRCHFFFLPGVPKEFQFFVEGQVLPWARARWTDTATVVTQLKLLGWGESHLAERFQDYPTLYPSVKLGYRAHAPEVWLKLTASGRTREAARAALAEPVREAMARVGDSVFGQDDEDLPSIVHRLLSGEGIRETLRFGTAESCTGGLVAELLTRHAGSSSYFQGSIVAYSNAIKQSLLGVPDSLLREHGAVSPECVAAMASGALERLGLDLAVSISGIAGPAGGTAEKPVGLVYLGLAWREGSVTSTLTIERRFRGERVRVQKAAALTALDLVRRHLLGIAQIPAASG